MQAEHQRPRGFIISPSGQSVPLSKPLPAPRKNSFDLSRFSAPLLGFFSECANYFPAAVKRSVSKCLSIGIVICSVFVFFNIFTFGTAVYHKGKIVAVTEGIDNYNLAMDEVRKLYSVNGITAPEPEFSLCPMLFPKSRLVTGSKLTNRITLCSPAFSYGCTVYSDGIAIFTARDEATARKISEEYIAGFRIDDNTKITTNIEYKTQIVARSDISEEKECSHLLANNKAVRVTGIVNTTENIDIPFDTHTTEDSSLYIGDSVTVTEGKNGQTQIESETIYENGTPTSSKVLSENVVATPVSRVIRVGTKTKDVTKTGVFFPLQGTISSGFGERWGKMHEGIDIAVPEGTPVIAAECGKVVYAGDAGTYGKLVRIDHGHGVVTAYAHLRSINVKAGQAVSADTQIALSGNTGRSTGPHLHFEIVKDNVPLNPNDYLKRR